MKILTVSALVLALTVVSGPAFAQHGGGSSKHQMGQRDKSMDAMAMKTMMMGLNSEEKMIANKHWKNMTLPERDVMLKRAEMCMQSSHKGMSRHMDEKAMWDHMNKGLSSSDQRTMRSMWSMMSAKEKGVAKKMVMNACGYGMRHH